MKNNYKDIVKGVESVSVNILDNGYTLEFTGNTDKGDWITSKTIVSSVDELCEHIKSVVKFPRE